MRTLILGLLSLALAGTAQAQVFNQVNTESNAASNAESASQSGAAASSNNANTVAPNQSTSVGVGLTFEAAEIPTRTTQRFETNTAVPLAASVSFSSDYCGGTASAGASAAGISLGAAKPMMDRNCQSLRRAEKFGVAAANAHSVGLRGISAKLIAMQVWEICMSEANVSAYRGQSQPSTQSACEGLGLLNSKYDEAQPKDVQAASVQKAGEAVQQQQGQDAQRAIIRGSNGKQAEVMAAPRGN